MSAKSEATPPHWLLHLAWLLLAGALAVSIGGALVLGAGWADPPRAGPLVWEDTIHPTWKPDAVLFGQTEQRYHALPLPPFTIEVAARFSSETEPSAHWMLTVSDPNYFGDVSIIIYGDQTFTVMARQDPLQPREPFIHLRPIGELNLLALDVRADSQATLRLNDEVAWRGNLRLGPITQPKQWFVTLFKGNIGPSSITWERMALYAPSGKP